MAAAVLILPSVLAVVLCATCTAGAPHGYYHAMPAVRHPVELLTNFSRAVTDYLSGHSFRTFWGAIRYLEGFEEERISRGALVVDLLTRWISWAIVALWLLRLERTLGRIVRIYREGRRRLALNLLLGNPLAISLLLFVLFMLALYTRCGNLHLAQGRNWFPFLPALLLAAVKEAPQALHSRPARRFATALVVLLLGYHATFGAVQDLAFIKKRYYPPPGTPTAGVPSWESLPLEMARGHNITWEGPQGLTQKENSLVIIRLPSPQRIKAVKVEYTMQSSAYLLCQWYLFSMAWWQETGATPQSLGTDGFVRFSGPEPTSALAWIDATVDTLQLCFGTQPCRFCIHSIQVWKDGP
jgi:hypothetical protein